MNNLYEEDLQNTIRNVHNISLLKDKTIFITGASGLIGSFLIDLIMVLNKNKNYNTKIVANARNKERLEKRFSKYLNSDYFEEGIGDINKTINYDKEINYLVNCASNTHPKLYSTDPIGTIMTNINGTYNMLELATKTNAKFLFLSSVEIYGENINNIGRFKENEMGYIDCNTARAGYNEAKRAGEALCQSFKESKNIEINIVRLPRIYGPTIKKDDSKVMSQFINKALCNENIVLKSDGTQYFSYLYVADAVSGMLEIMINGKNGEAYNLGNVSSDIHLKDLAKTIADITNVKVVFDLPDESEKKGFSKATDARLDYTKISSELGWNPKYDINSGVRRTIRIMKEKKENF